jgi:hypothetical protein
MAKELRKEIQAHERERRTAEREMEAEREREREREWRWERERHERKLSRAVELGAQNTRRLQEIEQRRMVEEAVEKAVAAATATMHGAGGGFATTQRHGLVRDELAWRPAEGWLNEPGREWEREGNRPWERGVEMGFYYQRRRSSLGGLGPRGISLARGFAERLAEAELQVERRYEREMEREREGERERGRRERRGRGMEGEKESDTFWTAEGRYVGERGRRFGPDRRSGY